MEQVADTETIHDLVAVYEPETMIKIHGFEVQLQQAMILGRSCLENMAEADQISYIANGLAEAGTLREEHTRYVPQIQTETEAVETTKTESYKRVAETSASEVATVTPDSEFNYQNQLKQVVYSVEPVAPLPEAIIHANYDEIYPTESVAIATALPSKDVDIKQAAVSPRLESSLLIKQPDTMPHIAETTPEPMLAQNVHEAPAVPEVPHLSPEFEPPVPLDEHNSNPIAQTVAEYTEAYLDNVSEIGAEHYIQLPEPQPVYEIKEIHNESIMTPEDLIVLLQPESISAETEQGVSEEPVIVSRFVVELGEATPEQQVELQPLVEQLQTQLIVLTELLPEIMPEKVEELKLQIVELCAQMLDVLAIEYTEADLNELVEHIMTSWQARMQQLDNNLESLGTHERKLFKKLAPQFQSVAHTGLHVPLGMLALIHLPHRPQLLST